MLSLKPWLVGKDPLEIDKLYTQMGEGSPSLSGTRTDGSAHNLMRAVSGIEMALWDLAGKILEVPTSTLLGGKFRDKVRVYDHAAPRNMLDKASSPTGRPRPSRTRAASPATSSACRTPIPPPTRRATCPIAC